jgi:ketosteroid isomerase-like protein
MSKENVEIVRRIYRAWEVGGTPLDSGLLADDIEWANPSEAVDPGTRSGISGFGQAVTAVDDAFEGARLEFERFIDVGDEVVVIATLRGTGRGSGIEVERRQGYVWTIRDGLAVRFRWFNDPADALEAVGVRE